MDRKYGNIAAGRLILLLLFFSPHDGDGGVAAVH